MIISGKRVVREGFGDTVLHEFPSTTRVQFLSCCLISCLIVQWTCCRNSYV